MQNALYLFNKEVQTLKNYVNDNTTLSVNVDVSSYPVKISFFAECKQTSFFDDNDRSDSAAELQFIFYDKMQIKTKEDMSISEEVFNKLKTLSKECNRLFLNAFFAKFDNCRKKVLETFDQRKGIDKIGKSAQNYEGKEYYLALIKPQDIINSIIDDITVEVD